MILLRYYKEPDTETGCFKTIFSFVKSSREDLNKQISIGMCSLKYSIEAVECAFESGG